MCVVCPCLVLCLCFVLICPHPKGVFWPMVCCCSEFSCLIGSSMSAMLLEGCVDRAAGTRMVCWYQSAVEGVDCCQWSTSKSLRCCQLLASAPPPRLPRHSEKQGWDCVGSLRPPLLACVGSVAGMWVNKHARPISLMQPRGCPLARECAHVAVGGVS